MLRFIGISFFFVDLIIMKFVLSLLIDSLLRADVCKYQPHVCNSKKLKILKKIHKIALGKLLVGKHV